MTCRDTQRLWNERLDGRGFPRPEVVAALEAHAEECPACAMVGDRYRTLDRAISAWAPAPAASAAFLDRLRRARVESATILHRRPMIPTHAAWLSAAAALILLGLIGWRAGRFVGRDAVAIEPPAPRRTLTAALSDATTATFELARETSAPAGRVGRVVLASAELPRAGTPPSFDVPLVPTSAVSQLRSVGDRVEAGVVPLSDSARQAFGFLLRPVPGDAHQGATRSGS